MIRIGKFFSKMLIDREEDYLVYIKEGMENLSSDECMKIIEKMFVRSPKYKRILYFDKGGVNYGK